MGLSHPPCHSRGNGNLSFFFSLPIIGKLVNRQIGKLKKITIFLHSCLKTSNFGNNINRKNINFYNDMIAKLPTFIFVAEFKYNFLNLFPEERE